MAVFYPKNLERIVRDLLKSRCDQEYIRHYMMEEFKVGEDVMNEIFKVLGVQDPNLSKAEVKRQAHKNRMQGFKRF